MISLARWLVILGLVFILIGGVVYLVSRTGIPLGRLPGDIRIVRENFTCVFPLATSIILSIALTIILNLIIRTFGGK
jgi:Protein of unknown function (DUF2905)